jgi:predicted dehydrogenase
MKKHKNSSVRLAIIGTGGMGRNHAQRFGAIKNCKIVAAVDIDRERVSKFCMTHSIPQAFTSVEDMLKNIEVDAVSIVTPDAFHKPMAIQCLKAKKHVFCEKPLALNYSDANKMLLAARKAGVVHMVNFSYRNLSALQGVAELVNAGKIGEIRHVEASYLQSWLPSKVWGDWRKEDRWLWRLSTKHGSKGVLGDIGIHIVDFATYPVGPISRVYCQLKTFPKTKGNKIGKYVLDANDSALLNVEFKNGAAGTIHTTRWAGGHKNDLRLKISGTKGAVEIDSTQATSYKISIGADLDSCKWKEVKLKPTPSNYERFIKSIRTGKQDQPDFARGAEIQKVLDACFKSDKTNKSIVV